MAKFNVTTGKVCSPVRVVIYGVEGIGKSTLASKFPQPLYLDVEDGTKQLDVDRYPQAEDWKMLLDEVDAVIEDPGQYKTLVLDTADRAEQLLITDILETNKVSSIEMVGGGYGKGYTVLQERFLKELLRRLDKVIQRGLNVVVLAHAAIKTITPPDAIPYDHWSLKVSRKVEPVIKEWADILAFCDYKISVVSDAPGQKKGKAKGSGKRMIHFNHQPTYDAKNRFGLPDDAEMDYAVLKPVIPSQGAAKKTGKSKASPAEKPAEEPEATEKAPENYTVALIQKLAQDGVSEKSFESWLQQTGRVAPGMPATSLNENTASIMLKNYQQLLNLLRK